MNDLYQDLYYTASVQCANEGKSDAWTWEKLYTELIVKECLSQMSDHLDKQRIIKHFGITED